MSKFEKVEILLEGLDETNITSILNTWKDVTDVRKKLDELETMLKTKIKTYLKERQWDSYMDKETKISVSISTQKRESIDKEQLKMILDEGQLASVSRISTFEKMTIITPEARARLKKYVKTQKRR